MADLESFAKKVDAVPPHDDDTNLDMTRWAELGFTALEQFVGVTDKDIDAEFAETLLRVRAFAKRFKART